MNQETWGVVIGRFQAPSLHSGHRKLLQHVAAEIRERAKVQEPELVEI